LIKKRGQPFCNTAGDQKNYCKKKTTAIVQKGVGTLSLRDKAKISQI
jgi:hypothetical protein